MQRIAELRRQGMWSARRLPKIQEPLRCKSHWDYVLDEMQWLAVDFAQERRWKMAAARKVFFICNVYKFRTVRSAVYVLCCEFCLSLLLHLVNRFVEAHVQIVMEYSQLTDSTYVPAIYPTNCVFVSYPMET
jgi:HSA